MSDTNIEYQLRGANTDLNRRIALLEEALLEKERAGRLLQDSEKRYRRLFESAKDGILILDAETGKVVDVNPFLLRLLGYSYDALMGNISGSSVHSKTLPHPRKLSRLYKRANTSVTRICRWKPTMDSPSP
jgi:PAS domain-containing protein